MKKTLSALLGLLISLNSFAVDVKPIGIKKGDAYVRVTKLANKRVKFERCISGAEKLTCKGLGNKASYSVKELQDQRNEENNEVIYALLADAGIGVVAVVGWVGAFAGVAMATTIITAAGTVSSLSLVGLTGGMVGVTAAEVYAIQALESVDAINPVEQGRQRDALNTNVINDEDVEVSREKMNEAIERLDFVLSDIK